MDNKQEILRLLRSVADGTTAPEDALLELKESPFEDLGYAMVDFHRSVRQGAAEVIYGAGKTPEQIAGIVSAMGERGCRNILITRSPRRPRPGGGVGPPGVPSLAKLAVAFPAERKQRGNIVVATGGTSDMPWRRRPPSPRKPWGTRSLAFMMWASPGCTGCCPIWTC